VGSSFVEFNGHGFWSRDAPIETLLALLVLELEKDVGEDHWLEGVLDDWALRAAGGLNGCVDPQLDWHLCDESRLERVLGAARAIGMSVPTDDGVVEVEDPSFRRRAVRVLRHPISQPGASSAWLRNVAEAFVELLEANWLLPAGRSSSTARAGTSGTNLLPGWSTSGC
jgi:hypothetical protein